MQWTRFSNPFSVTDRQREALRNTVVNMETAWSNGRPTLPYIDALSPVSEDAGIDIDDFVEAALDERTDHRPLQDVIRELHGQIDNASVGQVAEYARHLSRIDVNALLQTFGVRRDSSSGPADHSIIFGNRPNDGFIKQVAMLLEDHDGLEQQWSDAKWSEEHDAYVVDFYTLHDPDE